MTESDQVRRVLESAERTNRRIRIAATIIAIIVTSAVMLAVTIRYAG